MALHLPTPTEFRAFPYNPPYAIQVDLMRHLYTAIEHKNVSIIESPTGTGKTLSLLCASLTWLADERDRARKGKLNAAAGDEAAAKDWVAEQTRERVRRELEADEREYEARLAEARKREALVRKMAQARVVKKPKRASEPSHSVQEDDDDRFLPDDGQHNTSGSGGRDQDVYLSPQVRALMAKLDGGGRRGFSGQGEHELTCTKIYYASRTHSQLSQVLPELRKLKLSPRVTTHHNLHEPDPSPMREGTRKRPADDLGDADADATWGPCSRTVALGSRKQLCINDDLRARVHDLDEGCRELLGEKNDKRCQYLPPIEDETRMLDLRDQILASPKDIEDLAAAGRMAHTCPYFGSRRAIQQAELVTLPYNLLLQKSAREALGIDLTNQIVVIDEAHNLIPTLLSLSTTRLPYATLATSLQQVCIYVSKFRTRLGGANMLHLKRLVVFLDALKKYVLDWKELRKHKPQGDPLRPGDPPDGGSQRAEVMTVAVLMEKLGRRASGINLLEIEGYLRKSKVARKIAGYSEKEAEKSAAVLRSTRRGAVPPLSAVEAFMVSLTGTNEDGRVTLSLVGSPGQEDVELKYQPLNPAPHFMEVVDAARAVILAGGTMSPISDVVDQLFTHLPGGRVTSFSCGHVIPASSLQTLVVGKGPCGGDLEYKAGKQRDSAVIAELGQILLNFASVVPKGMVVFFPSYNFLNLAKATWLKSGLLSKLGTKKKVFFEPEETADVDKVLQEYASAVNAPVSVSPATQKKGGALLFAVIGAKLSEGLNFADDLARAVLVVGLPYANLGSPELRERMRYVKRVEEQRRAARPTDRTGQKDAAAELYENMCMNAVNQSIGRAIRHRGDWAALILLDRRYASASVRSKLPGWIGSGVTVTQGFGQAVAALGAFYRARK